MDNEILRTGAKLVSVHFILPCSFLPLKDFFDEVIKLKYIDELREQELEKERKIEEKKEAHKCTRCVWGHWDGNVHFCMFSRCFKEQN